MISRHFFFAWCTIVLLGSIPVSLKAESASFRGITEPSRYSTISATVPGRIKVIKRNEGKSVKKGDVILELENETEALEVARRKLIAESKVELTSAEYQVNTLKRDYDATKKLFESTQSVSEEELWKKDLEYKLAIAEHNRLKMMEEKEEIEYKIALAQLHKRIITAPFSGVVVKVHLQSGESCNAQEPLVRVVNIRRCRFITYVEASASHGLASKMNVTLKIDGNEPPVTVTGVIEYVSPEVDPSSGLREVKVTFNNPDGKIQPGVTGKMVLQEKK